jgi:hypothetical protein
MQDDTRSEEMSQEDIRTEMRKRFDAVNQASEEGHKKSRDANALIHAREDQRWVRPADAQAAPQDAGDPGDTGGNDSSGG